MDFDPSDLAANLPPPRDDEPPTLRQDIVDELADHLECALRRELLRGGTCGPCETASGDSSFRTDRPLDSSFRTAQQTVLTRFGDPAAIARRLWLDAMKETIMAQRLMLTAAIVLIALCCGLFALMWRSMDQQRTQFRDLIAETRTANASLVAQAQQSAAAANTALAGARKLQQELTASLKELTASSGEPLEWNSIEIKLVSGPEKEPAEGIKARLVTATRETGIPSIDAVSDQDGMIRLEHVRYGTYSLQLDTPWQERQFRRLTVHPGENLSLEIECPGKPASPQRVVPRLDLPSDLEKRNIAFAFAAEAASRQLADGYWSYRGEPLVTNTERHAPYFLVTGVGSIFTFHDGSLNVSSGFGRDTVRINRHDTPHHELHWPDADYSLSQFKILFPVTGDGIWMGRRGSLPDEVLSQVQAEKTNYFDGLPQEGWLGSSEFTCRVEPGSPGTLWIRPHDDVISRMREYFQERDFNAPTIAVPGGWQMVLLDRVDLRNIVRYFRDNRPNLVDVHVRATESNLRSELLTRLADRPAVDGSRRTANDEFHGELVSNVQLLAYGNRGDFAVLLCRDEQADALATAQKMEKLDINLSIKPANVSPLNQQSEGDSINLDLLNRLKELMSIDPDASE